MADTVATRFHTVRALTNGWADRSRHHPPHARQAALQIAEAVEAGSVGSPSDRSARPARKHPRPVDLLGQRFPNNSDLTPAGDATALRLRNLRATNTVAITAAIQTLHRTGSAIGPAAGGGRTAICNAAPAGTTSAAITLAGPDSPIAAPTTPSSGPSNTLAINQNRDATPHQALPSNSTSAP